MSNQEAADLKVELAHAKEANQALLVQLGAARVLLSDVVSEVDLGRAAIRVAITDRIRATLGTPWHRTT